MGSGRRKRVAVVGGGVAGITSSYLLQGSHDVTLLEKNDYLGGHTNTFTIEEGPDEGLKVDTGFIVLNDKTYPRLHWLLEEWGVPVRYSDMSFSFYSEQSGFQYSGTGRKGLFPSWRSYVDPRYYRLFYGIYRFCKDALYDLEEGIAAEVPLSVYLAKRKVSDVVRDNYILPMGAAIWSSPAERMLDFPALTFLRFFKNHGLLQLEDRPRWQTIVDGSEAYVQAFLKRFRGKVLTNFSVQVVKREGEGVVIRDEENRGFYFDEVVLATHADQARTLLAEPTEREQRFLRPWSYERNSVLLHTDTKVLPPNRNVWASWNYREDAEARGSAGQLSVTYHMNRLQGLASETQYCVSLNADHLIDPAKVLYSVEYEHPRYDRDAIHSQQSVPQVSGEDRVWFAGSYCGYGFHEDAVRAGIAAARGLGGRDV